MSILKRRDKQGFWRRMRESVWPTMGWRRAGHYYRHRVFRTGDSTYKITAGLAIGIGVSFTPFLGTHFLQAVVVAFALRANWIAAFVGTAIGNPWTFPFLFALTYKVGVFLCGLAGDGDFIALPDDVTLDNFMDDPFAFLAFMFAHPLKFLLPMTVGGYVCGVAVMPLSYALLYMPVRAARKAYRLQRRRKRVRT
ncbi:MAG: DUF2062 domain-containing protein, partial [Alphaproteobacteria bacterium]|nr:DUF2062 domain-containing protein [Alphaproteobacteria bacterium]